MCFFFFFSIKFSKNYRMDPGSRNGIFFVLILSPDPQPCCSPLYCTGLSRYWEVYLRFLRLPKRKTLTGFSYQQIFDIFTSMLPSLPLQKGTLQSVLRIRIYYYADPDPGPKKRPYGSEGIKTKEEKLHTKNVQLNLSKWNLKIIKNYWTKYNFNYILQKDPYFWSSSSVFT